MQRRFRLTRSTDFKRVRGSGKSYAHPLVVLIVAPSTASQHEQGDGVSRIGIAAGRSVGGAVARNRAKRLLREACRPLLPQLSPGNDIILIARAAASSAGLIQMREAVDSLFERAKLMEEPDDPGRTHP
jgi:ribonuclease P protein component